MLHLLFLLQVSQATVTGVVRGGEARSPLVGAVVALPDLNRTTTTDASGRYSLTNVPAGPQHITVRFIGHTPHTLHALVPPSGTLEINVALKAEPYHLPTLTVQPSLVRLPGLDDTDSSAAFPDRSTTIAAVRNHPLLSEPDAFQALSAGEVVMQPEQPSGVHIRGGATDQTGFLLDGIPVFNPYHAAGIFSAWNPDALATLRLTSAIPEASDHAALSGTIAGATRTPGSRITTQGGLSTTQARITVDGPIGIAGAGFLVSLRTGLPATFAPGDEASYLQGETGDWLAKLELPALGGPAPRPRLRQRQRDRRRGRRRRGVARRAGAAEFVQLGEPVVRGRMDPANREGGHDARPYTPNNCLVGGSRCRIHLVQDSARYVVNSTRHGTSGDPGKTINTLNDDTGCAL